MERARQKFNRTRGARSRVDCHARESPGNPRTRGRQPIPSRGKIRQDLRVEGRDRVKKGLRRERDSEERRRVGAGQESDLLSLSFCFQRRAGCGSRMRPVVNRITYASCHEEFETLANPRGTPAIFLARAREKEPQSRVMNLPSPFPFSLRSRPLRSFLIETGNRGENGRGRTGDRGN